MSEFGEYGSTAEQYLVGLVLERRKPGALVSLVGHESELAAQGLHAVPTGSAHSETGQPNLLAISFDRSVSSVLADYELPNIREIEDKLRVLIERLGEKTVAEALAHLNDMPRGDSELTPEDMRGCNLEKPEVAVLEGVLLGFRSCDITYYYETRYAGKPRDVSAELKTFAQTDFRNAHILCPDCVAQGRFE